ncbi:MAG: leucine-rich repeat protein [Ruminococcus flavefaciens]|nr:leucine-rich repeat protein [Ruminococcus flavefaciens]MCM1228729.1 leucine-rich repeat protein [Ruminococcus flavefaciens]
MKKTIPFILTAVMLLAGCGDNKTSDSSEPPAPLESPASEIYEEATEEVIPTERVRDIESIEDFEYEILDGGVTITKYTGNSTDVVIPDTIEDVPVTKIGFLSFEAKFDVVSITLPETTEVICEGAFMDCSSLVSINIPESVTSIERSAFAACTAIESLVIPASVESIEMEAFTACESMTSLTINNPGLAYDDWGLEALPSVTVYAPENSAVYKWAVENNINVSTV